MGGASPIGELRSASERTARWMAAKVGTGGHVAVMLTNARLCVTGAVRSFASGPFA
jgi:hypothetical protein